MQGALNEYYGSRAVWLDHAAITLGDDFAKALNTALAGSDVLLAIIGPDWLTAEKEGRRRLEDPDDWVRREIVSALGLGRVQVIPVLVGDAQLPEAEELPEPLRAVPKLQAIAVRPERFEDDVDNLTKRIGGWRRRWHGFALWTWLLAAAVVVAGLTVALVLRSNKPPLVTPEDVVAVGGEPTEIDLLSWASDDRTGDLTLIVEQPVSVREGSVDNLGDGHVMYTGPLGFQGDDSFQFKVRDEQGGETIATAHVEVMLGRLGGDFNVAVSQFSATGADQGPASGLSESLYEQISNALEERTDVNIEVASPGEVGPLSGDTLQARTEAAALLAARVAADVVVMGTLETDDGLSVLSAEFYLSDRGLTDAEELAGVYPLDSVSLGTTDPLALSRAASQFLEPKITALSQLAIGLSHYQLGEYPEAEELFQEAAVSWPGSSGSSNGQEVVLSLLGNVSGLQEDLDAAEAFYRQALDLDPEYARARFGAAEVQFQRSKGVMCDGVGAADPAGLDEAIALFEEVGELPAPPLAFLPERARVEIGRIHNCLTFNGADRGDQARGVLESVIEEVADEPRLRDLAAEAHYSLGVYYLLVNDQQSAVEEFKTAVETTLDVARKRGFYTSLAVIHLCQLDQPDLADAYLEEAQNLPGPPLDPIVCTAP
ncbi:MAG: tetratricopeptide repeat protein [Actinomycetota bacterium]|nr:tetratricopeptide repeat protein [Actinomycetota bacterium]